MSIEEIAHLHEKVLAGELLTAGAGKTSVVLDRFASWLLASIGGALAVLLSSESVVGIYLPVESFRTSGSLFFWAVVLVVIEKYLSSMIVGTAETAHLASGIGRRIAEDGVDVDFSVVFEEINKALIWPGSWFVARSQKKLLKGDFSSSGRNLLRCAQIQGFLVLLVAVLSLIIIARIINDLIPAS